MLVKLTLLHDRTDIPFLKTAFLQVVTEMLSSRKNLPDKGEVFVSMTEILLFIIQQQQQIGDME